MVNLPNESQHLLEIGRNGSGKTQAGCWHLSLRPWHRKPYVIFDTKGDDMLQEIARMDGCTALKIGEMPGKKGLHVMRPMPHHMEDGTVENFLWHVLGRGNVGLYFDEGYMLGMHNKAYNAVLTQGRSLKIPVITLSQRPAWLTRFAFTESTYYQIFWLTDREDRKSVQRYVPHDLEERLPEYHSLWYDVKGDQVALFKPVPPRDVILNSFRSRLAPKRVYL